MEEPTANEMKQTQVTYKSTGIPRLRLRLRLDRTDSAQIEWIKEQK